MILDIHTHHEPPQEEAVISISPRDFKPFDGQLWSVGIHPWKAGLASQDDFDLLEKLAERPDVVIIGECGIDTHHPGAAPMYKQMLTFKRHIELSEKVGKPLLIHEVKAHDVILGLRNEIRPTQPWIIHGFRAKPSVLQMLSLPGIYFSFGSLFNPASLQSAAPERILAETDESEQPITDIIAALSEARGEDLLPAITANIRRLIGVE